MNVFSVLRVNYEVFHSRMLHWFWTPDADHGAGDRFWCPMQELLAIPGGALAIDDEVKIDVPTQQRWRLADLLIRTGDLLILVENKVDPSYQDAQQVADEIEGGKAVAESEGRRFLFVLVAPGPLSTAIAALIEANGGVFVPWDMLLKRLSAVRTDDLDPHLAEIVRQYIEFASRAPREAGVAATDDAVREAEQAIRGIVAGFAAGQLLTAIDVWALFTSQFPDHVTALDARWEGARNYSAKSWFAAMLQRWAATRNLVEDTGQWQPCREAEWGHPKIRIYKRVA